MICAYEQRYNLNTASVFLLLHIAKHTKYTDLLCGRRFQENTCFKAVNQKERLCRPQQFFHNYHLYKNV